MPARAIGVSGSSPALIRETPTHVSNRHVRAGEQTG